jgi:adenosine deaminase
MSLESFIRAMPKIELHVHLEGAISPETLLELAHRNRVSLPFDTVDGLRSWYAFTDFPHFIEVYRASARCIRTPDDIELICREFLQGQAAQNILHSEVIFTPLLHWRNHRLSFADQLAAINRARVWAAAELGVTMNLRLDIPRSMASPEEALMVTDWAIVGMADGVVALGLGGNEVGYPPEMFQSVFRRAREAGLASMPHAGETVGPESIWGALHTLHADRIGHGVRCLEDPALVEELRKQQIPLEVCPTSNVCLKVVPDWSEHPLPRLIEKGLYVTINSDDPPMFNTTLSEEFLQAAQVHHLGADALEQLVFNALCASHLPAATQQKLEEHCQLEFTRLRRQYL